jgi:hypothetical protein
MILRMSTTPTYQATGTSCIVFKRDFGAAKNNSLFVCECSRDGVAKELSAAFSMQYTGGGEA